MPKKRKSKTSSDTMASILFISEARRFCSDFQYLKWAWQAERTRKRKMERNHINDPKAIIMIIVVLALVLVHLPFRTKTYERYGGEPSKLKCRDQSWNAKRPRQNATCLLWIWISPETVCAGYSSISEGAIYVRSCGILKSCMNSSCVPHDFPYSVSRAVQWLGKCSVLLVPPPDDFLITWSN